MSSPVRALLLTLFLIVACSLAASPRARAQDQETKLVNRILRPNMELGNSAQNKTFAFSGNKSFQSSGSAYVKDFYFTERFSSHDFVTKNFQTKNYRAGDFKTDSFSQATKTNSAVEKNYATKAVEVKNARENGKDYTAGSREYASAREFLDRGKSQKKLDQENNKGPKTIDDVRDLLNKNK